MTRYDVLFEGRSKQVCKAESDDKVILHFLDRTSAFNDIKKAVICGKGEVCSDISSYVFGYLNSKGVQTHFLENLGHGDQLCRKVSIVPVEFTVRNYVAGSMARRLNLEEGVKLDNMVVEMSYRIHELGNPAISSDIAVAMKLFSYDEISYIRTTLERVDSLVTELFAKAGVKLVDFKAFFGRDNDGKLILANEISPETCRLWDSGTGESLDKDRFRKDLDDVLVSYQMVLDRLNNVKL